MIYFVSVNCTWSSWSPWDNCSATCGGGTKIRSRFVSQPSQNGGSCSGKSAETQSCGETPCDDGHPVNCIWGSWTDWRTCSNPCGTSAPQIRSRIILQPVRNGGTPCSGESSEHRACPEWSNCGRWHFSGHTSSYFWGKKLRCGTCT